MMRRSEPAVEVNEFKRTKRNEMTLS
ncbi:cytochrome c biogenesis B [Iris pallida]|uniref:Cytochrome c biogenesis B (Mitochondrion) n=1 Tax=Iris pallida TaxID=29817 RepID=A0AAX6GCF6_IRIPA|nr:cytochrome c biogenesis B [Iris pallida]